MWVSICGALVSLPGNPSTLQGVLILEVLKSSFRSKPRRLPKCGQLLGECVGLHCGVGQGVLVVLCGTVLSREVVETVM